MWSSTLYLKSNHYSRGKNDFKLILKISSKAENVPPGPAAVGAASAHVPGRRARLVERFARLDRSTG